MHANNTDTLRQGSWVVFSNQYASERILMLEPHGIDFVMQPQEELYIYLAEYKGLLPEVHYSEDVIGVFAFAAVVYEKGIKVWDYLGLDMPLPTSARR